jgi:hypothetical protein
MFEVTGRIYFYFLSNDHYSSFSSQYLEVPNNIECSSEYSNLL